MLRKLYPYLDGITISLDSNIPEEHNEYRGKDQVTVMIHTGSRGLGHQVATDFIGELNGSSPDILRHPVDRQLNSARIGSSLADRYIASMGAAANFGFVNRQVIISRVREAQCNGHNGPFP